MFDKGQKLACINDDFSATVRHLYRQLPRKDGIYTVREVRIGRLNVTSGAGGGNAVSYLVLLKELHNPDDPYMRDGAAEEMGFRSDRFAPLEEIENTGYAEEEEALVRVERRPSWPTATRPRDFEQPRGATHGGWMGICPPYSFGVRRFAPLWWVATTARTGTVC